MKQKMYLLLMLVAMLFAACGDDDDEPKNPVPEPQPEQPAVISFDDFSSLIGMSYSSMIKQYPEPAYQFGDFYIYENVKPNVESLTIAVNPDNQTVYMVIEGLKENAYKEADIDAYFKSKLKFYGVEQRDVYDDDENVVGKINDYTYGNTDKAEDATLIVTLSGNEDVVYVNPQNQPEEPDGPALDDMTPIDAVNAFILGDLEEIEEEYPGVFTQMGEIYAAFMEENPWLMGVAFTPNGSFIDTIVLLYNEELSDDDIISYYTEAGYTCTKTGVDEEEGTDIYTFTNGTYAVTYSAGRGVVVSLGELD